MYYTVSGVQIYSSEPQEAHICYKETTLPIRAPLRHACGGWRFLQIKDNVSPCVKVRLFLCKLWDFFYFYFNFFFPCLLNLEFLELE